MCSKVQDLMHREPSSWLSAPRWLVPRHRPTASLRLRGRIPGFKHPVFQASSGCLAQGTFLFEVAGEAVPDTGPSAPPGHFTAPAPGGSKGRARCRSGSRPRSSSRPEHGSSGCTRVRSCTPIAHKSKQQPALSWADKVCARRGARAIGATTRLAILTTRTSSRCRDEVTSS
ncbi:hypothetical protein MTO96_003613 [Rhipicephalus appendiculatus]